MRTPLYALPLLLLIACGDSTLTVRGTLLPGGDATDVYVVGQPLRSPVEDDSFVIAGIRGEVVELEFAEEGDRLGRMRIEGWSEDEVQLRGIWLENETAFASGMAGDEGAAVVNGLRMAVDRQLPFEVAVEGVVLAVSGGEDALIVRPVVEGLPDLRVVLTPGTAIEREDGEGRGLDLEFGDSLRVEGTSESGYVVATRVVLHSRSSTEDGDAAGEQAPEAERDNGFLPDEGGTGDEQGEEGGRAEAEEREREGPGSLVRPGGGRGRGRGLQRRD